MYWDPSSWTSKRRRTPELPRQARPRPGIIRILGFGRFILFILQNHFVKKSVNTLNNHFCIREYHPEGSVRTFLINFLQEIN